MNDHTPEEIEDGKRIAELERENAELRRFWREDRDKLNRIAPAALQLLSVLTPIDWPFVFSAPMNGQHNAPKIKEAIERLSNAFPQ